MGNSVTAAERLRALDLSADGYPSPQGKTVRLDDGRDLGYVVYGVKLPKQAEGEDEEDEEEEKGGKGKGKGKKKKAKKEKEAKAEDASEKKPKEAGEKDEAEEDVVDEGKVRNVLYFHGNPGSRFFFLQEHAKIAKKALTRVIVVERPGYGLSSPKEDFTLLSWADDVEEFINKLGLAEKGTDRRCWVLGYSLGSPFAAACAYKLADYLHGVLLAGSISPHDTPHAMEGMTITNKMGWYLSHSWPGVLGFVAGSQIKSAKKDPVKKLRKDVTNYSAEDEKFYVDHPEIEKLFVESALEIYSRPEIHNAEVREYCLLGLEWGLDLKEIQCPIKLWSGEADRATTPNMSKHLEKMIPNCEGVYVEGKGHFLIFDVWEEMLEHMATIEQSGGKHESEEQDKKKKKQKKSKQHKTKETKNDKAD